MISVYSDTASIRRQSRTWRTGGRTVCLVPTMGALHDGHLSLVRIGLEHANRVVASIFVNPTQFGPGEDFERYPRTLEEDRDRLERAGVHAIFAPEPSEIYPEGHATFVTVEGLAEHLCGRTRPGHFRGVATVVTKLFTIVEPDVAVFGMKDAQQLAVIRRLTRDLHLDVAIVTAPIVREPDGLAMSSRNSYLSAGERSQAPVLFRALSEAETMVRGGEVMSERVTESVRSFISTAPQAEIEYVEIVDPDDITPMERIERPALLAVAVRFGNTRLIDNTVLVPSTRV